MSPPSPAIADRRLYLVCDAGFNRVEEALRGGVDILQLRDRTLTDRELLTHARRLATLAHNHGALFFVNDRVDIALLAEADGVHIGQDDLQPRDLRRLCGSNLLIGQSTHDPEQISHLHDVDYFCVGPVHETPTKPGRPAVGHELVAWAAAHAELPWFAIGGINPETAPAIAAAGATRFAVVRAITRAHQPQLVAAALRDVLNEAPGPAHPTR